MASASDAHAPMKSDPGGRVPTDCADTDMTNTSLAALPVAFPAESRISGSRRSADLADAYAIDLPDRATRDPKALARFIFSRPPPAMRLALKARDLLVLPFGI